MTKTNHTDHSEETAANVQGKGKNLSWKVTATVFHRRAHNGFRRSLRKYLYYNSKPKPLITAVLPFLILKLEIQ